MQATRILTDLFLSYLYFILLFLVYFLFFISDNPLRASRKTLRPLRLNILPQNNYLYLSKFLP